MYDKLFDKEKQIEMVSYFYNELAPKGVIRKLKKNEIVDPKNSECIYIVVEGSLRQYVSDINGNEKGFFRLSKGTIFGEMDYFEGERTCVITKVLKDSVVSVVKKEILEEVLKENPQVYRYFLHSITRKYRILMMDNTESLFNDSLGKLASLLLRMAGAQQEQLKDGIVLEFVFTHQDLANRIGCSRITITKGIKQFKSEKIISIKEKLIVLEKINGLMEYINPVW